MLLILSHHHSTLPPLPQLSFCSGFVSTALAPSLGAPPLSYMLNGCYSSEDFYSSFTLQCLPLCGCLIVIPSPGLSGTVDYLSRSSNSRFPKLSSAFHIIHIKEHPITPGHSTPKGFPKQKYEYSLRPPYIF